MMTDYSTIRNQLEEELRHLIARAEQIDEDLSEPDDEDWEDRANDTEDDEVLSSVGNVTLDEIEQIKRALHQIDQGTYGICARCQKAIPESRLQAIPYATTCVQCA